MLPATPTPGQDHSDGVDGRERIARSFRITGQVQGVGFRPFVFRLAAGLGIAGSVRNDPRGVVIEAYATRSVLDVFTRRLRAEAPPLARIDALDVVDTGPAREVPTAFRIASSDPEGEPSRVTTDAATCHDCLRELFDPGDRRFHHPLINCTNCGPRYTIICDVPYDRPSTTMAPFPMCPACEAEYRDPTDRRFHAQPTCCRECGPVLRLVLAGAEDPRTDPILGAAALLDSGGILAVKGLGGYHLAADATNEAAVRRLRDRKRRDLKPFALMVPDLCHARELVSLSPEGLRALESPAAPIVLAVRRAGSAVAPGVAPGLHRLGVMLPHTPVQHLLMAQGFRALVMTSANLSDDPLITDDHDALERLSGIADAWLLHDRPIRRGVDDSVVLDTPLGPVPLRRARGLVPTPIALPGTTSSPGICMGADLKSAAALVVDGRAILSQHLGDLTYSLAYQRFRGAIDDLTRLYRARPAWVACDAHPAYVSHRYAVSLAHRLGVPMHTVHHHHAHLASVLAEHGHTGPAVGLICDGVGYGHDATAWGGEVLVGDLRACTRVGRLRPLRLPGGDAAARKTGRCAMSWIDDALGPGAAESPLGCRLIPDAPERATVATMLTRSINCPPSSGLGRLFDGAAALLGVCTFNHFEAMSGMMLESLSEGADPADHPEGLVTIADAPPLRELDHRPLARRLVAGVERGEPAARLARLFHESIALALAEAACLAAKESALDTVALSGGVFCNSLLASLVHDRLVHAGLKVLTHRLVPPNDGGIALGQAAVCAARLANPVAGD